MLSSVELDYIKALINTYYGKGYKYYLCHTVTESNNDYDICIYFSKNKIESVTSNYFDIKDGIKINIDSSSKSTYNVNSNVMAYKFKGSVDIDIAEFIYTNSNVEYFSENVYVNPDLSIDYSYSEISIVTLFFIVIIFIYIILHDILGLGRS